MPQGIKTTGGKTTNEHTFVGFAAANAICGTVTQAAMMETTQFYNSHVAAVEPIEFEEQNSFHMFLKLIYRNTN